MEFGNGFCTHSSPRPRTVGTIDNCDLLGFGLGVILNTTLQKKIVAWAHLIQVHWIVSKIYHKLFWFQLLCRLTVDDLLPLRRWTKFIFATVTSVKVPKQVIWLRKWSDNLNRNSLKIPGYKDKWPTSGWPCNMSFTTWNMEIYIEITKYKTHLEITLRTQYRLTQLESTCGVIMLVCFSG